MPEKGHRPESHAGPRVFSCHESGSLFQWTDHVTRANTKSGLMADIELSSHCVDIRDFEVGLLADRFASVVNEAEELKSRTAARLTRNRQQLRSQI